LPSLPKSYRQGVAGWLQCQQSAIASYVDVNISSLKHVTEKNTDVPVLTSSNDGFLTAVNKKNASSVKQTPISAAQPSRRNRISLTEVRSVIHSPHHY
jgi:hypothetical protein